MIKLIKSKIQNKLIFAISTLIIVIILIASTVIIANKREELLEAMIQRQYIFGRFATKFIYDFYAYCFVYTYAPDAFKDTASIQQNTENVVSDSIFNRNKEVNRYLIFNLNGEIEFDSNYLNDDEIYYSKKFPPRIAPKSIRGIIQHLEPNRPNMRFVEMNDQPLLEVIAPNTLPSNEHITAVAYYVSLDSINKEILETTLLILGIAAGSIIISVLSALLISKSIVKPIQTLEHSTKLVAEGNYNVSTEIDSIDEIGSLAQSFNTMTEKVKNYSQHLEDMVAKRTEELNEANKDLEGALEEITGLKIQQDGDYFLTSLLINPLSSNSVESQAVKVDFYFSQKKKFNFREKQAEIGGDISIAHTVVLSESGMHPKEYTVFVNADAMGKSIQGAGGSLVLGVVFNAFITRTKYVPGASNVSPEEWLVSCYRELQDVFVSFEGSMLISATMGIIDDENGAMYYFNAEHPWTVLYREGQARFIEEELLNRKIGTIIAGKGQKVKLRTIQLKPKDIIISGSDGRDDLLIGYDEETGLRIINEDEELFLQNVEKGKGKLREIVKEIKKIGELTDDLSLIRISYQEKINVPKKEIPAEFYGAKNNGIKAYSEKHYKDAVSYLDKAVRLHSESDTYIFLIKACMKSDQFERALGTAEKAISIFTTDQQIMLLIALLYKKARQFEKAIYYSKRLYIHNQNNLNNLINLADCYRYLKDRKNAVKYLKEEEKIESSNINVIKLKNALNVEETEVSSIKQEKTKSYIHLSNR